MIRTLFILLAFHVSFSQNYWQQHVEYEMDINVDVSDFTYDGDQSIIYTNNSNDTISKVYYHLFFNAFKPNSQMDTRSRTIRDPDRRVGSRIVALEKEDYGDIRNSPIESQSNAKVFSEEETLVTEPITVILSSAGWIRSAKGHDIDPASLNYRGDDSLKDFCRGRNNQNAVFLDSQGKAYSMPGHTLPSARGLGDPITGRVSADSGVEFMSTVIGNDDDKFMISNSAGYGYISEFQNMVSAKKSGKAFMKLPKGAKILKAFEVKEGHKFIVAVSSIGRLLIFSLSELPILAKGKGNKIINIPKVKFESGEESLSHIALLAESSSLRIESGKRFLTLKIKDLENYISSRAKRGNLLPQGYRKVDAISEELDPKLSEAE